MNKNLIIGSEADLRRIEAWITQVKSDETRRSYTRYARRFLEFIGKPLTDCTESDVQAFIDSLQAAPPSSRATISGAVRAFLIFSYKSRILPTDLGKMIRTGLPRQPVTERILDKRDIAKMMLFEVNKRNYAIIIVLYSGALLISEVAGLKWGHIYEHSDGSAMLTVGGGQKRTRHVQISSAAWKATSVLRGNAGSNDPVFLSKKGGHLDPSAVHRVVKGAAERAGLPQEVSTYWLRHSQASHSLERGVPVQLIQAKLGHADRSTTKRYA